MVKLMDVKVVLSKYQSLRLEDIGLIVITSCSVNRQLKET